jgi:RNA recognition motif-containing protein
MSQKARSTTSLFIANVPQDENVAEAALNAVLQPRPGFLALRVRANRGGIVNAFADFDSVKAAQDALQELNGVKIEGTDVRIEFSRTHSSGQSRKALPHSSARPSSRGSLLSRPASKTVHVTGTPPDATEREMAHIFRTLPGFLSVRVRANPRDPDGCLMCFVEFDSALAAAACIDARQGYVMDLSSSRAENVLGLNFAKQSSTSPRAMPGLLPGCNGPPAAAAPWPLPDRSQRCREPFGDRGRGDWADGGRRRGRSRSRSRSRERAPHRQRDRHGRHDDRLDTLASRDDRLPPARVSSAHEGNGSYYS